MGALAGEHHTATLIEDVTMPTARRPARWAAAFTLTATFALVPGSSQAATGAHPVLAPERTLPPDARQAIHAVRQDVRSIRVAAEGGWIGSVMDTVLALAGATSDPGRAGGPGSSRGLGALPGGLRDAVGRLARSVRAAVRVIGPVRRPSILRPAPLALPPRPDGGFDAFPQGRVSLEVPRLDAGARSLAPPSARTAAAAALVASALDRALPALRATGSPTSGAAFEGCDLVDQTPYLCVGSGVDNHYTRDEALLVDLGGDDVYENAAGGAPFLPEGGLAYVPVGISVDVAGDDAYLARPPGGSQGLIASGAATTGGVGVTVDLSGNDRYVAISPAGADAIVAQGAAASGGVGLLVDGGGSDVYSASYAVPEHHAPSATVAQGGATACSAQSHAQPPVLGGGGCPAGALVDLGGDDTYTVDAGSTLDATPAREFNTVNAQGGASLGTGVLYDAGGADQFSIASAVQGRDIRDGEAAASGLETYAQGAAAIGSGYLVEGEGPTSYRIETNETGGVVGQSLVQGTSAIGSAALEDRGGNDRYEVVAKHATHIDLVARDDCADAPDCVEESVSLGGPESASNGLFAQADGSLGSPALLSDLGGNDSYSVLVEAGTECRLTDERTAPSPLLLDVQATETIGFTGQGAGGGGGVGVLQDAAGTDSYSIRTVHTATAQAISSSSDVTARATSMSRAGLGQGFGGVGGVGALLDGGGQGDVFLAEALDPARAEPDPAGAFQAGCCWPAFQGAARDGGLGLLVADGTSPMISSSPAQGTCSVAGGTRGEGAWRSCSALPGDADHLVVDDASLNAAASVGQGSAEHAVARSRPILAFTPSTPASAVPGPGRIPVEASLVTASGTPVEGATVHFTLLYNAPQAGMDVPALSAWEVEAVTGPDGLARAAMPLDLLDQMNTLFRWRILATYDGSAALTPKHAIQPLELLRG